MSYQLELEESVRHHHAPFHGATFVREYDQARLTKQQEQIVSLMKDGGFRTLSEIADRTGFGEASISAQLRHIDNNSQSGYSMTKQRRGAVTGGCWEYQLSEAK